MTFSKKLFCLFRTELHTMFRSSSCDLLHAKTKEHRLVSCSDIPFVIYSPRMPN